MITKWWYLSFVDRGREEGKRWCGGVIVTGRDAGEALGVARMTKCAPEDGDDVIDGEVVAMELPNPGAIPDAFRFRLLTRADLRALDTAMGGAGRIRRTDGAHVDDDGNVTNG